MDSSSSSSSPTPVPHIAMFPFMAKGHTVPLIHLATLVDQRRLATVTFFTTPLVAPSIRHSLRGTGVSVVELPFPDNAPGVPPGVESTNDLPSISLLLPFSKATRLLQPHFERSLADIAPPLDLLVSDGFLGWTNASAAKFGIPRVVFHAIGTFGMLAFSVLGRSRRYPELRTTPTDAMQRSLLDKADLVRPFDAPQEDVDGAILEFLIEQAKASEESYCVLVNSFRELEGEYLDYWNAHPDLGPKAHCVGPVCLASLTPIPTQSKWRQWLDSRPAGDQRPVLYVAFGTHAELSSGQLVEIAAGLEESGVDFLWVVRSKESELGEGFESRMADRGMVVREWVEQLEILHHGSIRGHMTHCGWNSVTESICAGVPIMAWPMTSDNFLNAELAVEELRIGVRIRARDGTKYGMVGREDIAAVTRELLLGEKGVAAREKAKALGIAARKAMADGGSSGTSLEEVIRELHQKRKASDQIGRV